MSLTEKDWLEERRRLQSVTQQIEDRIDQLEHETGAVKSEVVDIRKHFWDDVTIDFSSPDDVIETAFSLRQQAMNLSERERRHQHSFDSLKKMRKLVQSPYFSRIDFQEDGSQHPEQIYLGIASLLDKDGETYLIYDWRAPISSLYYDFAPGAAAYETPTDQVSGEMTLKRQYVIRDGQLRYMFDTGVTIGDELLQQALSRNSDVQMKSIVATIQKEQNQIIRNDRNRMLIVQGAAGSGKTSAALQRVAYLLYNYRDTLRADQMVLFSPNPLFNSYISTVLPELGEENIQQTTFQEYLAHRLSRDFELEDPFSQIEYVLTAKGLPDYEARIAGIRYKSSAEFLNVIQTYKEWLEREDMLFKSVLFRGKIIVSSKRIKEQFYSLDSSIRLANRIILLKEWLLKEVREFEKSEWKAAWLDEEIELLEPEDYQRAYERMRRENQDSKMTFNDFEHEKELLARMVLRQKLTPIRKKINGLRFIDVKGLYRQLFTKGELFEQLKGDQGHPDNWLEICRITIERLEQSELWYEDATPFLYLKELVLGFQSNTSIRYVLIDEVQDYSPFQLEFLKRLFPRAKMTALGDINQSIYAHSSVLQELDPITRLYGPDKTELIRLVRSYRSTQEIVEFTRGMVPGGDEIIPFNRAGEKPKVIQSSSADELHRKIADDILTLQKEEGFESIAIICKTAAESEEAYRALKELMPVQLVTKTTPSFEKMTLILPAYLAKGVEFDAVLIYNGSEEQYNQENERKLFYTACTRAMHILHIFSLGQASPFVTDQPRETYL